MFSVEPFKKNIFTVVSFDHGYTCPLCKKFLYDDNKYEVEKKKNVINVKITYCDKNIIRHMRYCLHCEILFNFSHKFEFPGILESVYHTYIISKFEYENKVVLGSPHFSSFFDASKEIQERKFDNITFTCTCNNSNTNPNCAFPKELYPKFYKECEKSFVLEDVTDLCINEDKNTIVLIPKNTKPALKQ